MAQKSIGVRMEQFARRQKQRSLEDSRRVSRFWGILSVLCGLGAVVLLLLAPSSSPHLYFFAFVAGAIALSAGLLYADARSQFRWIEDRNWKFFVPLIRGETTKPESGIPEASDETAPDSPDSHSG